MSQLSVVNCPDCQGELTPYSRYGKYIHPKKVYEKDSNLYMKHTLGYIWTCACCQAFFHSYIGKRSEIKGGFIDTEEFSAFIDIM